MESVKSFVGRVIDHLSVDWELKVEVTCDSTVRLGGDTVLSQWGGKDIMLVTKGYPAWEGPEGEKYYDEWYLLCADGDLGVPVTYNLEGLKALYEAL